MKLIHISDLHIGKKVNEFSMLDEQRHILGEIIRIADEVKPNCILIAGDVYDKSVPPSEAITVFDSFLNELSERTIPTFIIAGNHDSPERLSFGNKLIDKSGIHISSVYDGTVSPFTLTDEWGKINIYMLPFIKPADARRCFPDKEINSYTDAVKAAVENINIPDSERNIMVTHQFVCGAKQGGSEEISVGGSDAVDTSVFADFDYTALGHIHSAQSVGCEKIRYCGTPLKYSFSEVSDTKSVTVTELREKGVISVKTVPLHPLHDMAEIRGCYQTVTAKSFYDGTNLTESYLRIILTDEEDIPDAASKLRTIYHKLMQISYDNTRTRASSSLALPTGEQNMSPFDFFSEFYFHQNNRTMSDEQIKYINSCIDDIWEAKEGCEL